MNILVEKAADCFEQVCLDHWDVKAYRPCFDVPSELFFKYEEIFADYTDCFWDMTPHEMSIMLLFWNELEA